MKILPTGLPTKYRHKRLSPEERLANLLNIYGIPNSYKVTASYIDYYRTKSFFSLLNLIKLLTNYGTAYCCAALAVSLGRSHDKEIADLELIYPQVNYLSLSQTYAEEAGYLPPLSEIGPYFDVDTLRTLKQVTTWFEYQPFLNPGEYIKNPLKLVLWLEEPFKTYFTDLTPESFFKGNFQRFVGFNTTVELNNLLEGIFT